MRFTRFALLILLTTGACAFETAQADTIRHLPVYFDQRALVQGAYSPYRIGRNLTATNVTPHLRQPVLTIREVLQANGADRKKTSSHLSCPVTEAGIPSRQISVFFQHGLSRLTPLECQTLRQFSAKRPAGWIVTIDGYASQPGRHRANKRISYARAQAAAACLTVPPTAIKGHGFVPLSAIHAKNRRVTVSLSPQEVVLCPSPTAP